MNYFLATAISLIFANNIVLFQFLGMCPFFNASRDIKHSVKFGFSLIVAIIVNSSLCWLVFNYLITPLGLEYLKIVLTLFVTLFCLGILRLVFGGRYFPLLATNCAIVGFASLSLSSLNLVEVMYSSMCAGIGIILVMLIMASLKERLDLNDVPNIFKGLSIAFLTAGMLSLAFAIFSELL